MHMKLLQSCSCSCSSSRSRAGATFANCYLSLVRCFFVAIHLRNVWHLAFSLLLFLYFYFFVEGKTLDLAAAKEASQFVCSLMKWARVYWLWAVPVSCQVNLKIIWNTSLLIISVGRASCSRQCPIAIQLFNKI